MSLRRLDVMRVPVLSQPLLDLLRLDDGEPIRIYKEEARKLRTCGSRASGSSSPQGDMAKESLLFERIWSEFLRI